MPIDDAALPPWSEPVFRAVAEVRRQARPGASRPSSPSSRGGAGLDAARRGDLARLDAAGAALKAALARQDADGAEWRHDARNALGALQGYAEMLLEEPGGLRGAMRAGLEGLVAAVSEAANAAAGPANPLRSPAALASGASPAEPPPPHRVPPGNILAVDDNPDNRELLGRQLAKEGHTALLAGSGAKALAALESSAVDLVLLDLLMPGMNGSAVLRRIKANEAWRAIPVIMISGQRDMDGIIACIEAGADDYLLKPFNPVLLQARIKAGLERKRWHDREAEYRAQLEQREQFIRAAFGRYVSDAVVNEVLERPEGLKLGGDLREVTILMSDIREFSGLCAQLPPEEVVRMLNAYLGAMTDIIMRHQGTIDEFIGDAILAIFGAPVSRADDALRAARCALDMQAAMRGINLANQRAGLPAIRMGIGINTGAVIAGNIGSERRSKYGVVGHQVNLTARIVEQAAGGEILASASTMARLRALSPAGALSRRRRTARVKGIDQPVILHPLQRRSPKRATTARQKTATATRRTRTARAARAAGGGP